MVTLKETEPVSGMGDSLRRLQEVVESYADAIDKLTEKLQPVLLNTNDDSKMVICESSNEYSEFRNYLDHNIVALQVDLARLKHLTSNLDI